MSIIAKEELIPGDHIYTWRRGILYTHHGIYIGNNKVIHLSGSEENEKINPTVKETSLEYFLRGGTLKRIEYSQRLDRNETLRITNNSLHDTTYNILFYNCEHFATYCASGRNESSQSKRFFAGLILVTAAITALFVIDNERRHQNNI